MAPVQHVIAVTAIQDEVHGWGLQCGRVNDVVAAETVDRDRAIGTVTLWEGHRCGESVHGHRATIGGDRDGIVTASAIELALRSETRGSRAIAAARGDWRVGQWPGFDSLKQDVVAGSAVEDVLARPADQDVVAGAAEQGVVAGAADQDVVAVAAVGGELDRRPETRGRRPRRRRPGR